MLLSLSDLLCKQGISGRELSSSSESELIKDASPNLTFNNFIVLLFSLLGVSVKPHWYC